MFEMPDSGKEHADAEFVSLADCVFVTDASAWLDDDAHTVFGRHGNGVVEGQEAVRCQHQAFCEAGLAGLFKGDLSRAYAVCLTGAYSYYDCRAQRL